MSAGDKWPWRAARSASSCRGGWPFWPPVTLREAAASTRCAAAGPQYVGEIFPWDPCFLSSASMGIGLVAAPNKYLFSHPGVARVNPEPE